MKKEKISTCILTYNSEDTVIETLDSIRNQSYGCENIELIISDDFSTDLTVSLIEKWLNEYENIFYKIIFNKNEKNLGISKNINIAWKLANSNWIKSLAGDDVLYSDALENFNSFDKLNKEVIFTDIAKFTSNIHDFSKVECDNEFFRLTSREQYCAVLKGHLLYAPSVFLKREMLKNNNYCDERYFIEDLPLWVNILKKNIKFHKLDHLCVGYRVAESVSQSSVNIENLRFFQCKQQIYTDLILPELRKHSLMSYFDFKLMFCITKLVIKLCNNKKSIFSNAIFALSLVFRPYRVYTIFCNKYY